VSEEEGRPRGVARTFPVAGDGLSPSTHANGTTGSSADSFLGRRPQRCAICLLMPYPVPATRGPSTWHNAPMYAHANTLSHRPRSNYTTLKLIMRHTTLHV
jgi:hypothetical protein